MDLLRFRLRLDAFSPFGTPPTSGTLFGQLCWVFRSRRGRDALLVWLGRLPAEPFLLSDLLPAGHLPKPLLAPASPQEGRAEDRKALKRRRYLPLEAWGRLRQAASADALARALRSTDGILAEDPPWLAPARVPHNRIDRRSGHTPAEGEGGLWFADDLWPQVARDGPRFLEADLYVRSALPAVDLAAMLAELGTWGFGRDASIGRGRFAVEGWENAAALLDPPAGGGAVRMLSLSQGVITPNMQQARWARFVLFGKVGREMTAAGLRPWKLPLVLAGAGATFAPTDDGPFGAWITGVHQDDRTIGHNAFHLAIPYREAAEAMAEATA